MYNDYSHYRAKKRIFWTIVWVIIILLLLLLFFILFCYNPYQFCDYGSRPLTIKAGICGCVRHPAVYELPGHSSLAELIRVAGGVTKNANLNGVELCLPLIDMHSYYVPCLCNTGPKVIKTREIVVDTCTSCQDVSIGIDHINILYGGGPETWWLIQMYPTLNLITLTYIPWYTVFYPAQEKLKTINLLSGTESAAMTVQEFINEKIDFYFWQNRDSFIKMVDYLGGVTMPVDTLIAAKIGLPTGTNHLSGYFAYEYVTCLDKGLDHFTGFEQTRRSQVAFIKAMHNKVKNFNSLPTTQLQEILSMSNSNITVEKLLILLTSLSKMENFRLDFYRLPGFPVFESDKEYYWYPDISGFIRKKNDLIMYYGK